MKLRYINIDHELYSKAVEIRINCFFKGMSNCNELINDKYEESGYHLICLNKEKNVIGTGRLNIENLKGFISQMAIELKNQSSGIGRLILLELIQNCEINKLDLIELNAREAAIEFYKKYGFEVSGEKYLSKKTGIIHQKMIRNKRRRDNNVIAVHR